MVREYDLIPKHSLVMPPLNADAMAVLARQQGQHPQFVFTYKGHAVWQVNTKGWRRAVAQAGLHDFRWHGLRHTWASRHAQAGTSLNVVREMGGWRSHEMVLRYSHRSAGHLLNHAERIVMTGNGAKTTVPE